MTALTIQQALVLREIDRSGDINAYAIHRAIKGRAGTSVGLASVYRILSRLRANNLIIETHIEPSTKNRIPMPFYMLTDAGREVLRSVQEALK